MNFRLSYGLLAVIAFIIFLRAPSLFEPYWYGDEGIYLAVGQALQRGAVLYRDIWDNKPPLLYLIYAISPTLFWAKLSATVFVLGTITAVYLLSQKIFSSTTRSTVYSLLTTAISGIFLSLPLLEGTIANAELYFTLPIVWGAYIVYRIMNQELRTMGRGFLLGGLLITAFLIKVPAIFDFMGIFAATSIYRLIETKEIKKFLEREIKIYFPVAITFITIIIFILLYFSFNNALKDFLTASFSQNASYVEVGSGPLATLSNPLFIKALLLLISLISLNVFFWKRKISKEFLFLSCWFGFSLYGALLSNRPYMHYILQIVPPTSILAIYLISHIRSYWLHLAILATVLFALIRWSEGAFALDSFTYYQNWFDYISERKSWEQYVNYFDPRALNAYRISSYLIRNTNPDGHIFVWADSAFIYVLSERPPATRFIQAHHLTTIDSKNYNLVIERLEEVRPKYILVERPVKFVFPLLEALLRSNYRQAKIFEDTYVYENKAAAL